MDSIPTEFLDLKASEKQVFIIKLWEKKYSGSSEFEELTLKLNALLFTAGLLRACNVLISIAELQEGNICFLT